MLKVSDSVKSAYIYNEEKRHIVVSFPEISVTLQESQIQAESFELEESLLEQNSIEFIGCISSCAKISIASVPQKLKNKKIVISIYTDNTQTEPVPLFTGYVVDDKRTSNKRLRNIVAYDEIYSLAEKDVTEWFNTQVALLEAGKTITIKQFRTRLFQHLGITQKKANLANDSFSIKKLTNMVKGDDTEETDTEEEEKIYALDLIKAICQINGVFGIIGRDGKFVYRRLGVDNENDNGAYPGVDENGGLYLPFIPGVGSIDVLTDATHYASYRSVSYEDYEVKGIQRVYVRQDEKSKAGYAGTDKKYRYYVQGNRFTLGTTKADRNGIAECILKKVQGVTYTPFTASCVGLPYLEVGDPVSFYVYDFEESDKQGKDVYTMKSFYVLSRTLKGIQSMTDTLSAQGEEKQRRFVSDLGIREDVSTAELKEQVDKNTDDISSQGNRISELETGGWNFVMVDARPTSPAPKTIYFVKGTAG